MNQGLQRGTFHRAAVISERDRFWFYGISGNAVKTNVFSVSARRLATGWISIFCRNWRRVSAGFATRLEFDAAERYCLTEAAGARGLLI